MYNYILMIKTCTNYNLIHMPLLNCYRSKLTTPAQKFTTLRSMFIVLCSNPRLESKCASKIFQCPFITVYLLPTFCRRVILNQIDTYVSWGVIESSLFTLFSICRTLAIISLGLYIFYPSIQCGLYTRAVNITDNLCTKQGNLGLKYGL